MIVIVLTVVNKLTGTCFIKKETQHKVVINTLEELHRFEDDGGTHLNRVSRTEILDVQSQEKVIYEQSAQTQHQTVGFMDDEPGYAYDLDDYVDPTRMMQDSDQADLANFFERPIKIWDHLWDIDVAKTESFNPWELYFENPRVINRLANFNLLRCKLNLKILVNGTPFHFGCAIMSYNPLDWYDDSATQLATVEQGDVTRLSQLPHVYINPTNSQGGTLELPFFYYKNYLHIPSSDWKEMGAMYFHVMNNLKHAGGSADKVSVTVFAWASDVSLSVPTSVEPDTLSPQAAETPIPKARMTARSRPSTGVAPSEHQEANRNGIISGPATAVARVAGALKVIPALTPFATAAEVAADATAGIAKLFGFSRPAVVKDPDPYKPCPVSSMALTTVPDMVNKLAVDDQQGLTIDTRIAGVGNEDTLTIKGIASRESYLTTFNWNIGRTAETLLWNVRADPVLWNEIGTGAAKSYQFPACAFAALPFKYWTGTMKFRFQIIKSAFHKGRIKVSYDPNYFATNEYNTNFVEVIDIAEKNDFTIVVGNGQPYTLLEHLLPGSDTLPLAYSTSPISNASPVGNGLLSVRVVNELTTPDAAAADHIQINVFVSAGDDFEVFVPDDHFMNFTFDRTVVPVALNDGGDDEPDQIDIGVPSDFPDQATDPNAAQRKFGPSYAVLDVQSAEMDIGREDAVTNNGTVPESPEEMFLGPQLQYEDMISRVWVGEAIHSLRPLLRRYTLHRVFANADTTETLNSIRMPAFPILRGYVAGAIDSTAAGDKYTYVNTNLIHWVTMAHQGWRGGIRRKILKRGKMDFSTLYVQRAPISDGVSPNYNYSSTTPTAYGNVKTANLQAVKSNAWAGNTQGAFTGWRGQTYQVDDINPSLEFESPFYHHERFFPGKQFNYTETKPMVECFDMRIYSTGAASSAYDTFVAAAEDFQVFFFTGLPRVYYEAAPPS